MCDKLWHTHTFSNRDAYKRVLRKIFTNEEYGKLFPQGKFFIITRSSLDPWERERLPYLDLKRMSHKIMEVRIIIFKGWDGLRRAIIETKKSDVFGEIIMEMY